MKPRVLFRVAAGPRIGFGHLVRSRTLASALGVPPLVSVRGDRRSGDVASVVGCRLVPRAIRPAFQAVRPTLLVVDDPRARAAVPWVRAARQLGIKSASIHDMGLAPCGADFSIDGSIAPGSMSLRGIRYAIVDPHLERVRRVRLTRRAGRLTVLVAFGGGSRRGLAMAVAQAIVRQRPDVRVRIASGFRDTAPNTSGSITVVRPTRGLGKELANATLAVLAGGVTLYEACAVGLPTIGLSIVPEQRRAIAGLAARGAVIDGGVAASAKSTAARVARTVETLMDEPERQRRLADVARRTIDGRGAVRVAAALMRFASTSSPRRS